MDLVAELLQSGLGLALVGILGLLVGSFLNVVIYRLPIMMEREEKNWAWEVMHPEEEESDPLEEKKQDSKFIVWIKKIITRMKKGTVQGESEENGNLAEENHDSAEENRDSSEPQEQDLTSYCPHCQHKISAWANVPVIRWLIKAEKCRKCGREINPPNEESGQQEEKRHHPDVPQERFNLFVPASRCPHCQHKIRAWENIPVISWLIQGGKCRKCKNKISPRYLLVELLTAGLSVVVAWHFQDPLQVGFALIFTWALITLFFIDAETHYLPDRITLSLMWLGIAIAWYGDVFVDLHSSVLGAMIGYLSLWSVYWLFKLITGKEGMGHGDFKLLACLCAWQGPWMLPVILLIAPICALIFAVFARIGFNKAFAFGNFLSVTGWISLLYGGYIADWLGFFPG